MIDKGNVIYDRCSAGYELQTVVLGPSTSDDSDGCDLKTNGGTNPSAGLQQHNSSNMDHYGNGISVNQYGVEQPPPPSEPDDPFARFHPRLVQCVIEIPQRAKSVLLSRNNASTDGLGTYACDPLYYSAFACFTSSRCQNLLGFLILLDMDFGMMGARLLILMECHHHPRFTPMLLRLFHNGRHHRRRRLLLIRLTLN